MTSAIQEEPLEGKKVAFLEFPIVKPEYQDAIAPLFEKGIETLKQKGVEAIRTRAGEKWGYTIELTKKYGYTFVNTPTKQAIFSPNDINLDSLPEPGEIIELDFSQHRSALEKFIMEYYSFDETQAKGATDNLENIKDQSICHPLIFENNELVGRVLAYFPNAESKKIAYLTNVLVRGDTEDIKQQRRERLFRYVFMKVKEIPELEQITIFAAGPALENLGQYDKLKIEFEPVYSFYEKQI